MIANIKKTREIIDKYNLQVKKKFGQNFLIDNNIIKRIVECASISKDTLVIEIGPGIGALTCELMNKTDELICFEIDDDMIEILQNDVINSNVTIVNKDFLKVDLKDYIKDQKKVIVVSNLPYYITTPIITRLLETKEVNEIYVMVQDEVARRLVGNVGTKDYGSLSVLIDYYASAKYEFKVSRNCFYPSPNVDSAIVSMKKIKSDYALNNEPKFLNFIKDIFQMKRKTLVNNLTSKITLNKEIIEKKLEELGFPKSIRSESLELDSIVKIYKCFENYYQ